MRGPVTLCAALCLALFMALPAAAAPDGFLDAWFLYEQGKAKMDSPGGGQLGEALLLFAQAIDRRGGAFPEAELAIGDIYRAEGAFAMAQQQYNKAWEQRGGLEIPEEKYTVLYRLAELAEMQDKYGDMEKELLRVLEDQQYFSSAQHANLRDALKRTYLKDGLDQAFRLYRLEDVGFAAEAHSRLGWLFYRTGRYDSGSSGAVTHLLFALDIAITEMVLELRRVEPDYVFTTLEDFLARASKRANIAEYMRQSGFVGDLYYLAAATWATAGHPTRAAAVWRAVANTKLDASITGEFADLSRRQLKSPWVEPYLNPSVRSIEYPKAKP